MTESVAEVIAKHVARNSPCFCDRLTGGVLLETRIDGPARIDRIRCKFEDCGRIWKRVDVRVASQS